MAKAFSGTVFIDNVLTFWKERLKEYVKQHVIPAFFKLKFRIVPLSEEDRKTAENVAVGLESLVVFCICNA